MADCKTRNSLQSSAASTTSRIMADKAIRMVNFSSDSYPDIEKTNSSIQSGEEDTSAGEISRLPSLELGSAASVSKDRKEENVRQWLMDMDGRELESSLQNGDYDESETEHSIVHKQNDDSLVTDILLIRDLRKKRYSNNCAGTKKNGDTTVTEKVLIPSTSLRTERQVENDVYIQNDSTVVDTPLLNNGTSLPDQTKIQEHFNASNHDHISSNQFRTTMKSKGTQYSSHKTIIQISPKNRSVSNDSTATNEIELTSGTNNFSITEKDEVAEHSTHKKFVETHSKVIHEDELISETPLLDKAKIYERFSYNNNGDILNNDFNVTQREDDAKMLTNETSENECNIPNTNDHNIFCSSKFNTSSSKDTSDKGTETQGTYCSSRSTAFEPSASKIDNNDNTTKLEETTPIIVSRGGSSANNSNFEVTEGSYREWLQVTAQSLLAAFDNIKRARSFENIAEFQSCVSVTSTRINPLESSDYSNEENMQLENNETNFVSAYGGQQFNTHPQEREGNFEQSFITHDQNANDKIFRYSGPETVRNENASKCSRSLNYLTEKNNFNEFASTSQSKADVTSESVHTYQIRDLSMEDLNKLQEVNIPIGTLLNNEKISNSRDKIDIRNDMSVLFRERPSILNRSTNIDIPKSLEELQRTNSISLEDLQRTNSISLEELQRTNSISLEELQRTNSISLEDLQRTNSISLEELQRTNSISLEELQRISSITNTAFCHHYQNSNIDINRLSNNKSEMPMQAETNQVRDLEVIPNINTLMQLLSVDTSISKSILLALSSRQFKEGATLVDIETHIRQKQVAKTLSKLRQDIRNFLDAALDVHIIKRNKRRYILSLKTTQLIGKQIKKASQPGATTNHRKRNIQNMDTKITRRNKIPSKKATEKLTNRRNLKKDNCKRVKTTLGKKATASKHRSTTSKG